MCGCVWVDDDGIYCDVCVGEVLVVLCGGDVGGVFGESGVLLNDSLVIFFV